jgi:TonB family protein
MVVGDTGIDSARSSAAQGAPASGPMGSQLQLLSDPQNIDFKPYLLQILGMVRSNGFAVIPESARLGARRGLTVIQFIVDRRGAVPKLVIATPSGTEAFDRAAVASVSASYPFPPLPPEYKGADIRLQLAFAYNMNK